MLFTVCWVSLFALIPRCASAVSFGGGYCDVAGINGSLFTHCVMCAYPRIVRTIPF